MREFIRGSLREAVFGVQDGLVSTLGALTGIAEGTQSSQLVALSGLVIIAVESLSMTAGSYLSSKSQRQYLERLLREEAEAIEKDPEGERREIWAMYRARGYRDDEIAMVERRLFSDKQLLLEDMAHKELGISPQTLEEPLRNALVMGIAYAVGGFIPLLPYLMAALPMAMPSSIVGTLLTLFAFGALKGRVVKQVWWRGGLEMLGIAGLAALAGFVIGHVGQRWLR
jgi:predicted membrane protein (TIGR00267 family)